MGDELKIGTGGNLLYGSGGNLVSDCGEELDPPRDCCCFLDPSTPTWDSGTTFAAGDLCEYGTATYRSLQAGNTNHLPTDTSWWEIASESQACGNTDWDSCAPYGGPDGTPPYYTVTAKITFPSGATVNYYSDKLGADSLPFDPPTWDPRPRRTSGERCAWWDAHTNDDGQNDWSIYGYPQAFVGRNCGARCCPGGEWTVYLVRSMGDYCGAFYLENAGDVAYRIGVSVCEDDCWISGTYSCEGDLEGSPCCAVRLTNSPYEPPYPERIFEGGTMVISWRPGQVALWDACTDYVSGDVVAWGGKFYECIQNHNAGAAPECPGQIEPGVHASWQLYWEDVS